MRSAKVKCAGPQIQSLETRCSRHDGLGEIETRACKAQAKRLKRKLLETGDKRQCALNEIAAGVLYISFAHARRQDSQVGSHADEGRKLGHSVEMKGMQCGESGVCGQHASKCWA
jgi:hypothetical protein